VAAMAAQQPAYPVCDYLEGVGVDRKFTHNPLPFIAVPTTAGTGTEATKNAVISSQADGFKKSLRDRRMMAKVALISPELTCGVPSQITAYTGFDAITQLIEAYTTKNAQPVTDALALRGLTAAQALRTAYRDGQDLAAREAMALAAYLSGLCLANAGLGAAHGIAAGLGSVADIPHGLACALALPVVMAVNLPVAAPRYAVIATALTSKMYADANVGAQAALDEIRALYADLQLPHAAQLPALTGVLDDANLPDLAHRCHGNSLRGNPQPLDDDTLIAILREIREWGS